MGILKCGNFGFRVYFLKVTLSTIDKYVRVVNLLNMHNDAVFNLEPVLPGFFVLGRIRLY